MQRCLFLAQKGAGMVAPNPMVGAVLVYKDRIIGEGWHTKFGSPHAEIECFNSVKPTDLPLIKDSTLYVSLEPCAHFGKTPPCAQRIVEEKVRKVVIGVQDPFAKVNGAGISILISAGIEVVTGVEEEMCKWVNRRFFCFHEKKRPYIHLKWACSRDGFMAEADTGKTKISGPLSDHLVHFWRMEEAGIMIGTRTAVLDNPSLNNRYWSGPDPIRIVIDRQLKIPLTHRLLDDERPVIIMNELLEKDTHAKKWIQISDWDGMLLQKILRKLYDLNILSVLVEGGAMLLNSLMEEDFWDEMHIITNMELKLAKGLKAPIPAKGKISNQQQIGSDQINHIIK